MFIVGCISVDTFFFVLSGTRFATVKRSGAVLSVFNSHVDGFSICVRSVAKLFTEISSPPLLSSFSQREDIDSALMKELCRHLN